MEILPLNYSVNKFHNKTDTADVDPTTKYMLYVGQQTVMDKNLVGFQQDVTDGTDPTYTFCYTLQ